MRDYEIWVERRAYSNFNDTQGGFKKSPKVVRAKTGWAAARIWAEGQGITPIGKHNGKFLYSFVMNSHIAFYTKRI